MPQKKYHVDLASEARTTLEHLLQRGKASARKLTRARILLQADEGLTDEEIATVLEVGMATVERTRQRCVEENLEALNEHPRPGGQRKLSGKQEAQLIAVACTPAPTGRSHWHRHEALSSEFYCQFDEVSLGLKTHPQALGGGAACAGRFGDQPFSSDTSPGEEGVECPLAWKSMWSHGSASA